MSAYRIVEIVCDLCGEGESEPETTIANLRRRLRDEDGWVRSEGEDICGTCRTRQVRDACAVLDRVLGVTS